MVLDGAGSWCQRAQIINGVCNTGDRQVYRYEREYRMAVVLTSIARHKHRLQLLRELSRPHGSPPTTHYPLPTRAGELLSFVHSRCK